MAGFDEASDGIEREIELAGEVEADPLEEEEEEEAELTKEEVRIVTSRGEISRAVCGAASRLSSSRSSRSFCTMACAESAFIRFCRRPDRGHAGGRENSSSKELPLMPTRTR
jgi:hypothetical protein